MSASIVYLLVIISHGGAILKLDDCKKMDKPLATGRVVWWMQVAEQYGFKCQDNHCSRGHYFGYANTYETMDECLYKKITTVPKPMRQ